MTCRICNQTFESEKGLHRHIKTEHILSQEEYYQTYYPKYDKYTNELIPFKNKDYYFSTDFINRTNMINFIKRLAPESQYEFVRGLFTKRLKEKDLKFAPSQVELRSCILPSVNLLQKFNINYEFLMQDIALPTRYKYDIDLVDFVIQKDLILIQDTREQSPLLFKGHHVTVNGLNFGDYTCQSNFKNVFIERKSAMDLISTLSKGYDRFCQELDRAAEMGAYVIVLCESEFNDMIGFHYKPFFSSKTRVTADFLFHNIREVCQKYKNVNFAFCQGRKHMTDIILKIFSFSEDIRNYDIQYLIDAKKL